MSPSYRHDTPTLENLSVQHFIVLGGVGRGDSYMKMAKNLFMSKSWVKILVDDLVTLGLVERLPVKSGQGKSVKLSPAGERMQHDLQNSTTLSTSSPS